MRGERVIVIGAGITGLMTAWRLRGRGAEVLLLERDLRVGGLIDTETRRGFCFEHGPDAMAARNPLHKVLEDLRLARELAIVQHRNIPILEDRWIVPGVALEGSSAPRVRLRRGMASLVNRVAGTLGSSLRLGVNASRLLRRGSGFRVHAGRLGDLDADRLIFACPASAAATLLADLDSDLAHELASLRYTRVDVASFGFDIPRTRLAARLDDWPLPTRRWSAAEAPKAATSEGTVLRCVTQAPGVSDEDLVAHLTRELREVWSIRSRPTCVRLRRRERAFPIYPADHATWTRRVRTRATQLGRIALIGSAYDGIGIPECVASARNVAA